MAPKNSNDIAGCDMIVTPNNTHKPVTPSTIKVVGPSHLGYYTVSVLPLLAFVVDLACSVIVTRDFEPDSRVKGWFLMENPLAMAAIGILYIMFSVVWGPRWMKGRQPMQLKNVLLVYNAFQVMFSLFMFIEAGMSGWFIHYNYRCQPCDYSLADTALRMSRFSHWFFLSKLLDLADTVLFILRGKFEQVTMLHVIHHSCMFMSMWWVAAYNPGGHITFMGLLNSFVHTVMYSYYLLAALGPRVRPYLWWKKYLTALQLIQFICIFMHTAQLLVSPCNGVPTSLVFWTLLYDFLFFVLFINFFIQSYLTKTKKN